MNLARLEGREAAPASAAWNLFKTFFQAAIFWSTLLAAVPALLYRLESRTGLAGWRFGRPWLTGVGILLFAGASALAIVSDMVLSIDGQGTPLPLDCPCKLVRRGPYRHVRNPMAISGILQGFSVGLMLGSPSVMLYVAAGLVVAETVIRPWEERDLEARFGREYVRYKAEVPVWWPK